MRRRVTAVAVCCALAASIALAASVATAKNPAKTGGQTLGEWMTQWWEWKLGTGQPGQVKNVVMLPVPVGAPGEEPNVFVGEMDVALRPGQKFALPVFVYIGETYAEAGVPDDDPASIPAEVFTGARVLVTLDGKTIVDSTVDDLSDIYFDTQFFDEPIPYDEPVEYAPNVHAVGAVWVKGLGILGGPLSKGTHTLTLFVYSDAIGVGFDNTWNITVGK
jgi:hypothetical protein